MNSLPHCLLVGMIMLVAAGCSRHVSVDTWQGTLEQFAQQHANNDLAFLRDYNSDAPRRTFNVIGTADPKKSTDVIGVLLGRRVVNDSAWYIFLVGQQRNGVVEDIRIAMISDDTSSRQWLISDEESSGLAAYQQYKQQLWKLRHPGRTTPPLSYTSFPGEDDDFHLDVDGNRVMVVEKNSHARWMLLARLNDEQL